MTPYLLIKLVHIIAVIVFLGNILTGLFWMKQADQTKDPGIIHFTMKTIINSDKWFTVPGVIIITAGGIGAALYTNTALLGTGWIFWSLVLFSLSGIVFGWQLVPLQRKIYNFTSPEVSEKFNWNEYHSLLTKWEAWGLSAFLMPVCAMIMMVLKLPVTRGF